MDLTKILNQDNFLHQNKIVNLAQQGTIFFAHLLTQLEKDLEFLRGLHDLAQHSYFNRIRVLHGNIEENTKKNTQNNKNEKKYLFLQLPNLAGFLIESDEGDVYKMYRATKVNPVLHTHTGEITRPEIFVLKSGELEEFRVLDDCFVRTTTSDKTLSVKQMSEMLLLLAESVR